MNRILIAGIGNIFFGDDAFGLEVVRELLRQPLPSGVRVKDFGIRGHDLAYELADGYDAAILVDAAPRGEAPGTVYLIEPEPGTFSQSARASLDGHSLEPVRVLQMAEALGGRPQRLYLVGCEPGKLASEDGRMGLSEAVQAAVPRAIEMIQSLVSELFKTKTKLEAGPVPA